MFAYFRLKLTFPPKLIMLKVMICSFWV